MINVFVIYVIKLNMELFLCLYIYVYIYLSFPFCLLPFITFSLNFQGRRQRGGGRRPNNFEKKNKISKYLKVLINGTASDHLWSMVRKVLLPKCVYTNATWGVLIHIYLSVSGVRKQYTGFHNWTPPCFMYVHGSPLLIFLTRHFLRFLLGKYFV